MDKEGAQSASLTICDNRRQVCQERRDGGRGVRGQVWQDGARGGKCGKLECGKREEEEQVGQLGKEGQEGRSGAIRRKRL